MDKRTKIYAGKILSSDGNRVTMQFLRRKKKDAAIFTYPNKDDVMEIETSNIIFKMTLMTERRGHFTFDKTHDDCL